MESITNAILKQTSIENYSFLNWDGETSQEDLVKNIMNYVSRITGWPLLSVEINEEGILQIEAKKDENSKIEMLLTYSIPLKREIYGRLRHVGFTTRLIGELESIVVTH